MIQRWEIVVLAFRICVMLLGEMVFCMFGRVWNDGSRGVLERGRPLPWSMASRVVCRCFCLLKDKIEWLMVRTENMNQLTPSELLHVRSRPLNQMRKTNSLVRPVLGHFR